MRNPRTTQIATMLALALLLSECSRDRPTALPAVPTVPTAPAGPILTLSGVVTDVSGRPIPSANVGMWPDPFPTGGAGWSPAGGTADTTGHYKISGWPNWKGTGWIQVTKDGYLQQCVAAATIQADTTMDIELTALANLAVEPPATRIAAPGSRTVSGVIYQLTSEGRRPVDNAWVGWEVGLDFVAAQTRSNSAGRYLLCGLPQGSIRDLFAVKQGYNNVSYVSIDPGSDTVIDIEIK
jgi:carboxypeptidase family protein